MANEAVDKFLSPISVCSALEHVLIQSEVTLTIPEVKTNSEATVRLWNIQACGANAIKRKGDATKINHSKDEDTKMAQFDFVIENLMFKAALDISFAGSCQAHVIQGDVNYIEGTARITQDPNGGQSVWLNVRDVQDVRTVEDDASQPIRSDFRSQSLYMTGQYLSKKLRNVIEGQLKEAFETAEDMQFDFD
ncbi:hypothetical protein HDE_09306 [Halotydeus destructor]|nr:hypothetical protein HDE_09306 [Halotydeus destructor]